MRVSITWYIIVAIFNQAFLTAAANNVRHSAERVFSYYAYLADEITVSLKPGLSYIIAPGCAGSRAGGRCTFNEFLRYVWAPNPNIKPPGKVQDGSMRSTLYQVNKQLPSGVSEASFNALSPDQHITAINGYVDQYESQVMKHGRITFDWADSAKVMPGATSWEDQLQRLGRPIQRARQALYDSGISTSDSRFALINKGILASQTLVDWRRMDFENNRVSRLTDMLRFRLANAGIPNAGATWELVDGRRSPGLPAYKVISASGTYDKLMSSAQNDKMVRQAIFSAINDHATAMFTDTDGTVKPTLGNQHSKALYLAEQAEWGLACLR